MRRREIRSRSKGLRIAAIAAVLALAAALVLIVARLFSGTLNLLGAGGGGERDPQFAEPAERVTRPPELMGEESAPGGEFDPSAGWDLGEQTPVDKTAEQLSREAAGGS